MNKQNNTDFLFFISYFLIIFSDMFNDVIVLKDILQIIDYISIILLSLVITIKIIKKEYHLKYFSVFSTLLILILIGTYFSKNASLIKLSFLLIAMYGISFDKIICKDLKMRVTLATLITILSIFNIIPAKIIEYRNGLPRYNFGMAHPNAFAFEIVIIYIDYIYKKKLEKREKKHDFLFFIISILMLSIIFIFTGSRTNFILMFAVMVYYIANTKKNKNKITKEKSKKLEIINYLYFYLLIVSYAFAYLYSKNIRSIYKLDLILSKRIFYANYVLTNYGIKMLGNDISGAMVSIDNAYLNLLFRYGIVITAFFGILYTKTLKYLLKNKFDFLYTITILLLIYGLMETPLYIPGKCPYVLLLGYQMYKIKGEKDEEEN